MQLGKSGSDGGGGLPEELRLRESRRERIRAARAQLEAEKGRKLESRHQKSFADPEANMMKTGEGSLTYCYNAQAATSEDGIVVATELVNTPNDAPELLPMLDAVRANTGQRPEVALADAGYLSEANLQACRRRRQRCLVAVGRETKKPSKWPKGKWTRRMHRTLRLPWARELYGPTAKLTGLRLKVLPAQRFVHGACNLGGHPASVLYFAEIGLGSVAATDPQSGRTHFVRFTEMGTMPAGEVGSASMPLPPGAREVN